MNETHARLNELVRRARQGDVVQWGGRRLYADGRFATADGRARFAPVALRSRALPADRFYVSTRRGKQFNSMVQRAVDHLTGADRDEILIGEGDLARIGRASGDRVVLRSATGEFRGRLRAAPIRDGNLEVHWPEGNVLLAGAPHDPRRSSPTTTPSSRSRLPAADLGAPGLPHVSAARFRASSKLENAPRRQSRGSRSRRTTPDARYRRHEGRSAQPVALPFERGRQSPLRSRT